jgi:hypothetical protein
VLIHRWRNPLNGVEPRQCSSAPRTVSSANTLAPRRELQGLPHGHLPDVEVVLADVRRGPLGDKLVHPVPIVGDLPRDLEVLVELPGQRQEQGGLARPGRPQQQSHPPGLDDPADVVEDGHRLLPGGQDVERVPDGLEGKGKKNIHFSMCTGT